MTRHNLTAKSLWDDGLLYSNNNKNERVTDQYDGK